MSAPKTSGWRFGARLRVHTHSELARCAIDEVFAKHACDEEHPDDEIVTVEILPSVKNGSSGLRIMINGLGIATLSDPRRLTPLLEGVLVGHAVRSRAGTAVLHAACVELEGAGVLLAGPKQSGKSTLAVLLSELGARYLGDEVTFIRFCDDVVEAFPKAATIKEGSFAHFAERPTHDDPLRGSVRYVLPDNAAEPRHQTTIGVVLFPAWSEDQEITASDPVPQAITAMELVRCTFGGLECDRSMLGLIKRLASVPAQHLRYRDARKAAGEIARLIRPLLRRSA